MTDKQIKVLLIEDNLGDARLIQEMLSEVKGALFYPECADRLATGLERLATGGFDLALLDLGLPDSSGLETFLKAHAQSPQIPLIVLSGLDDEVLAVDAVQRGAQDYIVKGQVDSSLLGRAIRYAIARKKVEEELKAHREHIKLINKILRHDIINDLAVIKSALRLYERSKNEELLVEASAHVNKCVELINRMRKLESFISSHRNLKLHSVTDVLNNVIVNYPAIAFNIVGECQVLTDESLNSVIDNIIRNAVDHGKTDRIDIHIVEKGEFCEIRISDYGVGIPEEVKAKIFEESFIYGETGGTGLGLYIVKKAMENYGGRVYVEDNTPRGAVFVLTLRTVN